MLYNRDMEQSVTLTKRLDDACEHVRRALPKENVTKPSGYKKVGIELDAVTVHIGRYIPNNHGDGHFVYHIYVLKETIKECETILAALKEAGFKVENPPTAARFGFSAMVTFGCTAAGEFRAKI